MTTNINITEQTTTVTTVDDVTTITLSNTGLQGIPGTNSDGLFIFVRNATGALLSKGTIVYVSNANGTHVQVTPAIATGDATSARTVGWLSEDIGNNASGLCQIEGYLEGINTGSVDEGDQLYLSGTVAGGFTNTKPQAPIHLVYVGVCAKKSSGNGKVFVKVQNGYELDELHNVQIISVADKNVLQYDSATSLWKNVASTAITAGSAITAGTASYATTSGTSVTISGSITKSQVSDFTSGTVTSASTAQQAGTAVYATTSGTAVSISGSITRSQVTDFASGTVAQATNASTAVYATTAGTSVTISGSITRSQVSDYASGTVASASTAQTAGTAVYATTSGTSVSISGSITNSQVSDFASGTVANISGTVTQSQVSGLTTSLAGKANLTGGNSFTDAQIISASTATQIPLQIRAGSAISVNVQEWVNSATAIQASVDSNFRGNFPRVTAGSTADLGYAILSVNTGATANIGLVVRGVASQSASFMEVQNNAGNALFRVNNSGFGVAPFGLIGGGSAQASGANNTLYSTGTASVGLVVRGIASQSADLLQIQTSAAATAVRITSTYALSVNTASSLAQLTVVPASTATVGVVVQGLASQSANAFEYQNSTGGTVFSIGASSGFISSNGGANFNSALIQIGALQSGGVVTLTRATALPTNPGANNARLYFRDGTTGGTLKLVVRAGTAGAETTILDNIPQS